MPSTVSVVIPTYNRADLVARAIESALAAIGPGDEIIVADDGSTDETAARVEAFGAPVRLLDLPHAGAGPTRNAGLAAAAGDLVAFLDSDDEWFPDKIRLQRGLLDARPDLAYCCSDFGVKLEDGSSQESFLRNWLNPPRPLDDAFGAGVPYSTLAALPEGRADFQVHLGSMYLEEMRNNFIATFTLMVRREAAAGRIHFAEDLPTCEEWQAFGQLTGLGEGAVLATDLAWQHGHSGPRLTQASVGVWADAWLKTLARVWGKDQPFLAEHGVAYHQTVTEAVLLGASARARHGDLGGVLTVAGIALRDPAAVRRFWHNMLGRRKAPAAASTA